MAKARKTKQARVVPVTVYFTPKEVAEIRRRAGRFPVSTFLYDQLMSLMVMP